MLSSAWRVISRCVRFRLPWIFHGEIASTRYFRIFVTRTARGFSETLKLNDLFLRYMELGTKCLTTRIRQVVCGPCTVAEYKRIGYLAECHVMGRRRKRRACPYQDVRHGINGRLGGLREALFRRKGDEARNYGFAFIGVDEGPYHPANGWGENEGSDWFIGDYSEDIGTYAFCLTFAENPRWKLSIAWSFGKYENGFIVHASHRFFFCAQITARRDDRGKS